MLHIILLILKILGLLILGILGLIILAIALVLFASAGYSLEASGKDTLESMRGRLKFYWLFHLLSGEMRYEDGRFAWRMRAGWKKFGSGMEENDDLRETDSVPESRRTLEKQKLSEPQSVHTKEQPEKAQNAPAEARNEKPQGAHTEEKPGSGSESPGTDSSKKGKQPAPRKTKQKQSLYERLKGFWEKIKYTFQKICDNIKSLGKKKERLAAFVRNEVHKSAFFTTVRELRRLLKALRPRKAEAYAEFGFTDPAVTGYVLALISMFYPFIGEYAEIRPDFERRVLRGRIYAKGRIRAVHIAAFALRLLMDKNVRTTYRHIKKFKL